MCKRSTQSRHTQCRVGHTPQVRWHIVQVQEGHFPSPVAKLVARTSSAIRAFPLPRYRAPQKQGRVPW
eukprot:1209399-Karenia_brevis.AAC.1